MGARDRRYVGILPNVARTGPAFIIAADSESESWWGLQGMHVSDYGTYIEVGVQSCSA